VRVASVLAAPVAVVAGSAVVAATSLADVFDVDEQDAGYLFRYFADSDHVHVRSHFGTYGVDLHSGAALDVQWHWEQVVIPALEAPAGSDEAVDAITQASRPIVGESGAFSYFIKERNEVTSSLGFGDASLGYYVSSESDYFAQQLSGTYSRDFLGETLNLSTTTSYGWDAIAPLDDDDGGTPADTKTTAYVNLVATQALSPTTLLRVGGELNRVEGLQHNPYRNVYAGDGKAPEVHPDERLRRDLYVKLVQYFTTETSIRLDYRYYIDDWEIRSHMIGAKLNQYVTDHVRVRYRYRYYDQSAAYFHREEYETESGVDGYLTGDFRAGALSSHLFGTRLDLRLSAFSDASLRLEGVGVSLSYERYVNANSFSANVLETGITYAF